MRQFASGEKETRGLVKRFVRGRGCSQTREFRGGNRRAGDVQGLDGVGGTKW